MRKICIIIRKSLLKLPESDGNSLNFFILVVMHKGAIEMIVLAKAYNGLIIVFKFSCAKLRWPL